MKNKLGVSIMIGYILLIAGAIVMSFIIYQWMRTYVPRDKPECPEGVSLYISRINCTGNELKIYLKNNGRFSVDGYFIRTANDSNATIATIDLSGFYDNGGLVKTNSVLFSESFSPGENRTEVFRIDNTFTGKPIFIEIIPLRYEVIENRRITQICTNAKVKEETGC